MVPDAFASQKDYAHLKMPVVIVAGEEDRLIDINKQSARLHGDITQSILHRIPDAGHMVHQTETIAVMAAIDEATGASSGKPQSLEWQLWALRLADKSLRNGTFCVDRWRVSSPSRPCLPYHRQA